MRRWTRTGLVAAAALFTVTAVASPAQAAQGTFTLNTGKQIPVFNYLDVLEYVYDEELSYTYRLPGDKPVAEPANAAVTPARQKAMKTLLKRKKFHRVCDMEILHDHSPITYADEERAKRRLDEYMDVIDAAEIAYAAKLETAQNEESRQSAGQEYISAVNR